MKTRQRMFATVALLSIAPSSVEELNAVYETGSKIVYTETSTTELTATDVTMSIGDHELPPEAAEGMKAEIEEVEEQSISYTTEVLETEDGVPTKVRRSFETIEQSTSKASEDTELTGVLVGRIIVIEQDGEDVSVEIDDDGDRVDEEFLARHKLTNEIDALLPEDDADVGDTWTLPRKFLEEMAGLQSIRFFEDDDEDEAFDEQLLEAAQLEGQAKFEEIEEHKGLRCAKITFTLEMSAEVDDPAFLDEDEEAEAEGDIGGSVTVSMEVDGTLWFAMAEGRPVELKAKMGGDMDVDMFFSSERFDMNIEFSLEVDGSQHGEWANEDE